MDQKHRAARLRRREDRLLLARASPASGGASWSTRSTPASTSCCPTPTGPTSRTASSSRSIDALESLDDPVKIGFFDDTWTWGQPYFSDFWKQKPDLNDPEKAAKLIYDAKWKPFFSQVDKKHWYRFKGRPFIYFYNAGTLVPRTRSAAVDRAS